MRLLVVEDSRRLRASLEAGLAREGFAVDATDDGDEALWLLGSNPYDVVVLDLMLPGRDGWSVLEMYRSGGGKAAVIVLTARDAIEDRVRGLRSGADDYLVKPFAFEELLARLHALTRRNFGLKSPRLTVRGLVIDMSLRKVWRDEALLELAPREYALLELLLLNLDHVVSRTEIEAHLYDERAEPMSNVVDAAVYALRRKIDVPGRPSVIRTRRGMGYCVEREENCVQSDRG